MKILKLQVSALAFILMIFTACKTRKLKSPDHYKFSEVATEKLDPRLREISGIAWDPKQNIFYAINDESGKIFILEKTKGLIRNEYVFGDKGDYEDVAIYNGTPYVLRSDGTITKVMLDSAGKVYGLDLGKPALSGKNDFETLYTDPARKALVMICKNCQSDDDKTVSAYAYYPDSLGFENKPLYHIDAKEVEKRSPFKTSKLQPSGAAIHPILRKLYILSSASHQLVVSDLDGHVDSVYKLSGKLFPQPEGIAFKQNGDMYITNEGGTSKATMHLFVFKSSPADTIVANGPYDFSLPDEKFSLGSHLHEISGMAYIPGTNYILAENDEKGDIFTIDFKNKQDKVNKIKFGGKGDYEDIVYTDSAVYMLVSTGSIVKVPKDSTKATTEFDFEKGGKNEFETLYLDEETHSLIMLCKECSHEKDEIRVAYRFDLEKEEFSAEPAYTIHISEIQKKLGDDKAEFKPSAAGINPVTKKIFIVASVGKVLVIADKSGKVEQVFRLDPAMYNQPEGMTFAPNGDLYISNEGGEGIATILKFGYKKTRSLAEGKKGADSGKGR